MKSFKYILILIAVCLASVSITAQELTSSLYGGEGHSDPFASELSNDPLLPGMQTDRRVLSPAIANASYLAVTSPPPRAFAVHDLITIVIREDMKTDFKSSLETEKGISYDGEIAAFPNLKLSDLMDARITPASFAQGAIELDVSYDSEFEGEGDYSNQQSMTGRVQARIIDIKPNGTMVLEARKSVTSDHENYNLVATGTCRVDDVTSDNTIVSSQLADLFIDKQHSGYLKQAADKGVITRVLDAFFNL